MIEEKPTFRRRLRKVFIGGSRSVTDKSVWHSVALTAFLAWVGMGADGLSSSCYGPEEAFLALGDHHYLGILVAFASALTVFVLSASYSQIIELFPSGGGGYVVASKMLNPWLGMISGCALLIDYVLTIALSVAAGTDAVFSFVPDYLHDYKILFAVGGVLLLIVLNLRGVRESIVPLIPIMAAFVITHVFIIAYGLLSHAPELPQIARDTTADLSRASTELGIIGIVLLLLKSYSFGAGTYTGIEAVSNGLQVIREPRVENGKRTMLYMAVSLAFVVTGLVIAYLLYQVQHEPGKTLNAVLFERVTAGWPDGLAKGFVYFTLVSEAALLLVAAQTGFLGGPRVLANMAVDRWMPSRFGMLSDRLVTQNGILIMGGTAIALIIATQGSVKFLVVLYSITVFITFFLSQLGMTRHWLKVRKLGGEWKKKFVVIFIGLAMTTFILISVSILKFNDGGWLTLIVTLSLVGIAISVRRHYQKTVGQLRRLDDLLVTATAVSEQRTAGSDGPQMPAYDPRSKTAVLLVNGFNGLGLHTLLNVVRLFEGTFKSFVFVQVGAIDVGNFKGSQEVDALKAHIDSEGQRYVDYMARHGYYAESVTSIGVDVVNEIEELIPQVMERFPRAVLFGGQLVFERETIITRLLHNYTIFAVQKRLYHRGIPIVILPIRV